MMTWWLPSSLFASAFTLTMRKGGNVPTTKFTKSNLPTKVCVVCNRPFEWRKKWEKVWDEVKYCSDRCRGNRASSSSSSSSGQELIESRTAEVEANVKGYNSRR